MEIAFLLAKNDLELSRGEVLAAVKPDSSLMHGNLLICSLPEKRDVFSLQSRLAFTHSIHDVLFSCKEEEIRARMNSFPWESIYEGNFCIRIHHLTTAEQHRNNRGAAPTVFANKGLERMENFREKDIEEHNKKTMAKMEGGISEKNLAGIIWNAVENPRVKLRGAKTAVRVFLHNGYAVCTKEMAHDYKEFEKRRPHLRIFTHSGSMHPRLARSLVNLLGAKEGEKVIDPCCGSGGLLLEAALVGLVPEGYDINRKMVWGAMRNMAQQKLSDYTVTCKDALSLDGKWDYAITDLPYGLNTTAINRKERVSLKRETAKGKEDLEDFYLGFFKMLKRVLGKRAVIVLPHFVGYGRIISDSGLLIEKEFSQYVHKNLTRKILVLKIGS